MTIVDGTHYHPGTSEEIIRILERARKTDMRIRVHYGDVKTGQDWGDIYHVAGRVSRSIGPVKVPLLIANATSHGGDAMLDHCIVRIRYANRKEGGDLYRHPNYTPPPRSDGGTDAEYERNFS